MNCTQVLAYTLLAACAAPAAVSLFIDDGELQTWISGECGLDGQYISTTSPIVKAAVSMGMLAFALLAFSAAISSQRLRA